MEIIFNPKAGEIYSLFTSLYFSQNLNLLENHLKNFGVNLNKELKEHYQYIHEIHSCKKEQMDFFFNNESEAFRFFIVFQKIWECRSLDEYVNFIENMSDDSLKEMLVRILIDDKLKNDDNHIKNIASSNEFLLDFIKKLDIKKSSKWDLYCFIDNIEKYKHEFISLIKDYIPIFNKLFNAQIEFIDEVNNNILTKVNSQGLDFVKEYTNNLINLNDFKKIYLTSSYFDNYLIYFTLTNNTTHCYFVVGPYHRELNTQNDNIEAHLKVLKNLCDKTRFGIMKYILDDERYGQEIAAKFNISNPSVSYHMNNLLLLDLVKISKQDNKVFYKLNKQRLLKTIRFLEQELCLL